MVHARVVTTGKQLELNIIKSLSMSRTEGLSVDSASVFTVCFGGLVY